MGFNGFYHRLFVVFCWSFNGFFYVFVGISMGFNMFMFFKMGF